MSAKHAQKRESEKRWNQSGAWWGEAIVSSLIDFVLAIHHRGGKFESPDRRRKRLRLERVPNSCSRVARACLRQKKEEVFEGVGGGVS